MELVAGNRITRAQQRVAAFQPYAAAITSVLTAVATSAAEVRHPLVAGRPGVRRVGVLVLTADRGLCGAYNAKVIRTAEGLISRHRDEGREVALFVVGAKGVGYYRQRGRDSVRSCANALFRTGGRAGHPYG
jgi:F-type H+-transporting ATPase subunit gamma